MRMHFVVHSFLNLTVRDQDKNCLIGHRVKDRNLATRQSHLMTIDKLVFELKARDVFKPEDDQIKNNDIK